MARRRRQGGLAGTITGAITALLLFGLFLAVLNQFNGDLGALFQWMLDTAWGIVVAVRDSVSNWDFFQSLF